MTPPSSIRFRLGIVTGLQFEADIVRAALADAVLPGGDTVTVACHGPGPLRAADAAAELLDGGATALMSFGVAGGCDPALPSGTAIIATAIRDLGDGGEALYTNREWQRRLKSALLGNVLVEEAQLASTATPVTTSAKKRALFDDLGIAAVDMESAAVARSAVAAETPFMALRVIVDPQDMSLPTAALAGIRPDGRTAAAAVTGNVVRRPGELIGLLRLARHDRIARNALRRAISAAGPLLGAV